MWTGLSPHYKSSYGTKSWRGIIMCSIPSMQGAIGSYPIGKHVPSSLSSCRSASMSRHYHVGAAYVSKLEV